MSLIDPKVQAEPIAPVVTPVTPGTGEGVAPATPTPPTASDAPNDATAKLQRDLNQLKSASQRREAALKQENDQREAQLKSELEQTRLNSLEGEARKAYEQELLMSRLKEANDKLADVERRNTEILQYSNAITQFRTAGVPDQFLNQNGSLDDLVQSGWDWILSENKRLQAALGARGTSPASPPALPNAPAVPTLAGGNPASVKPTWAELVTKYGSKEQVYSLVEQRLLPASIIP